MQGDSYTDGTGREWSIREGARGSAPTWRAADQGVPIDRVALSFESGDENRTVSAPIDWRERRDELLPRLFADAVPRPPRTNTPPSDGVDEGLHGLSDAPGG
jgi:hypothetical protein